jgi:amidase
VAAAGAERPRRIAFTADFNGALPVDRETRAICAEAVRRFEQAGCIVEEFCPDLGALQEAFLVLRSQQFVVDREAQLQTHRALLKPDIVWNTERGLKATPSQLAWAERERAAWYRRVATMFATFDLFVTPGAGTPAFDVMLRHPESIAGKKLENYMAGSMVNAAITLAGCPAVAVPCGFDQYGRPIGLQVVAPPRRDERALQGAALFESLSGLDRLVPIDPRPGTVPPPEA